MWSVVAPLSVTITVQVPAVPAVVVASTEASLSADVYTCVPSASVTVTVAVPLNAALAWLTEAVVVVMVQLYVSVSLTSVRLDACQ